MVRTMNPVQTLRLDFDDDYFADTEPCKSTSNDVTMSRLNSI